MRELIFEEFNEKWKLLYDEEKSLLKQIFDEELLNIHHIGSTAIPGMLAKPVIDILIEVQDINHVTQYQKQMEDNGYIFRGDNGIKGRRYFVKNNNHLRTHHIHIYQVNSFEAVKHLSFRDYLIEHADEAERYKCFKEKFRKENPGDIKFYQESKSFLVEELVKSAYQWADKDRKISVTGYILRNEKSCTEEILTVSFKHLLRIPGGGLEKHESLKEALYREIKEETGLTNLDVVRELETCLYYKPFSKRMVERHNYLLVSNQNTSDHWQHRVTGNGGDFGLQASLKWIDAEDFFKIDSEHRNLLNKKYIPELFRD